MNILVCHKPGGAFGYISDSWINVLKDAGLNVQRWDGTPSSWHAFKPDLYIGCSGHRQHVPARTVRKQTKIAIHVNPYGPIDIKPSINESKNTILWVESAQPDVVFGYGFDKDKHYWSDWSKVCKWVPMPTAGDITFYKPKAGEKKYNLSYVGGYWPYKSKNIDKYLLPVFDKVVGGKIRGWGKWPIRNIIECSMEDKLSLFQRTKVCPCVVEPHTTEYGIDLPERVFKVILSGAVAVHDAVRDGNNIIKSVRWCIDSVEYVQEINKLLGMSDSERQSIWQLQFSEVSQNHTYHHRIARLLQELDFNIESQLVMRCLNKQLESI